MNRILKKKIEFFIFLLILITPFIGIFPINSFDSENDDNYKINVIKNNLRPSDVAGTDLYAEQISAYIAGEKSIIRQILFTNDTNIIPHFDTNDPAFYKCNILITASNGKVPEMFPSVLSQNIFGSSFALTYNSFIGFLYYDKELSASDAEHRASRALEIIRRKFGIDLIMVNSSQENFFPFVGYYPDWDAYFDEMLRNVPKDGYWKALDIDRLTSEDYLSHHHLSSTYFLLNSLELLEKGINVSMDQLNFNIQPIQQSFQNLNYSTMFSSLADLLNEYSSLFGNLTALGFNMTTMGLSPEEMQALSEVTGSFTLSNDSHYTTLIIQYEGKPEGIQKIGTNTYEFNLWKAMGYDGEPLSPSEKIYIALIGAFMSEIDINILGTEIIDNTPKFFQFSDYMLEQIGLILYLAGYDVDVQQLKNYEFKLKWVNNDGVYRSYSLPLNRKNASDPINSLQQLGFQGFPIIPSGLLNPISELKVQYEVGYAEPNMKITKQLVGNNATYGAYRTFHFNITAENVGNISVWGIPTEINVDLQALFNIIAPGLGSLIYAAMLTMVKTLYPQYDSLEEFLEINENPRIFYFDTWGTGIVDHYYPDLTNVSNLWPYSKRAVYVINNMTGILLGLGMTQDQIDALKDAFQNNNSIWNRENWYLDPGEKISYLSNNLSISNLDTFSTFYKYNFTIKTTFPELPALIYGNSIGGTNASMALKTDNESWIIESEQRTVDLYGLEVYFEFKNDTNIDFENYTLDRVSIVINYTYPVNLSNFQLLYYNFSADEYRNLTPYLISSVNNSYTYAFTDYNTSFDWLFDPSEPNSYKVKFKIKASDPSIFNISINDLNVEFSHREIMTRDIQGSRVMYASFLGNTTYSRYSNSFTLSTYDMASLTSIANLTKYNTKLGELCVYSLKIKNIGSDLAKNISLSILIPGIMNNPGNFTLKNNYLNYNLTDLEPGKEIVLNFSFYVPNSESVPSFTIYYHNSKNINQGNSSQLTCYPNQVYLSAPVDYEFRYPYLRTVEFYFTSNNTAPAINDTIMLNLFVKNTAPKGIKIPDLYLEMNDQYGDLKRLDNQIVNFTNILYNQVQNFSLTFKKLDWKAYYYPPINYFEGSESRTIQIASSQPIILGNIDFSIIKILNTTNIEIGQDILVTIIVKNTGNICIKDISLNDMVSFTQLTFSLKEGKLVNKIDLIDPQEVIIFKYVITAKVQDVITLKEASIDYYYLLKRTAESNEVDVKVNIPFAMQILAIIIPTLIAVAILSIYIWQKRKYKETKYELQRAESIMLELSSRDTILKIEHTLRERLNIIAKKLSDQEKLPKKEAVQDIYLIDFKTDRFCPNCGILIEKDNKKCNFCDEDISLIEPLAIKDDRIKDIALTSITDSDPQERRKAIKKLGQLKDPSTLGFLIYAFKNDEYDDVRYEALESIISIGHHFSKNILNKALRDKNPKIKRKAEIGLKKLEKISTIASDSGKKKEPSQKSKSVPITSKPQKLLKKEKERDIKEEKKIIEEKKIVQKSITFDKALDKKLHISVKKKGVSAEKEDSKIEKKKEPAKKSLSIATTASKKELKSQKEKLWTKEELSKKTVKQLLEIAKDKGIKLRSGLRKAQIIDTILSKVEENQGDSAEKEDSRIEKKKEPAKKSLSIATTASKKELKSQKEKLWTKEELSKKTVKQLLEIAKDKGIKLRSGLRKAQIIDIILSKIEENKGDSK
ncbi:MAG: Rho termination factor N-terminal domain-containing protein [Promethearchaeia archaeon]